MVSDALDAYPHGANHMTYLLRITTGTQDHRAVWRAASARAKQDGHTIKHVILMLLARYAAHGLKK